MDSPLKDSLHVIIIGAGIAGLSAAIALRRAGHHVKVYERSDGNNEVGAAIHICPNASRLLLSWGLDPVRHKFVVARKTYIANGFTLQHAYEAEYSDVESTYGAPWYFAHRVDLHNALKDLAIGLEGSGKPAQLIPNSRVVDIDAASGTVVLANSTTDTADLVVAADGVHSRATKLVLGGAQSPLATGQAAFRFLIPTFDLATDPETAPFLEDDDGRFKIFLGQDESRLVWYPCRDNQMQNFVGIFHEEAHGDREDWHTSAEPQELLDRYSSFNPALLAVLKKAKTVKKWPLLYREPISNWYKSKLVLIGDAAHPMLPHQGQAGAQAIEDAAALGIFLEITIKEDFRGDPACLSRRLQLFQDVRSRRAAAMQIFSNVGQEQGERVAAAVKPYFDGPIPKNPAEFMVYNFSYDVREHRLSLHAETSI